MRRAAALLAIPAIASVAIAGCSSSPSSSSSSKSASSSTSPSGSASASATGPTVASNSVVTASGTFGKAPTVTIPSEKPASSLFTKTLIQGSGPTMTTADSLVGNFVLYDWSGTTHKLLGSTYSSGSPTLFSSSSALLPGLQKALIGQKVGSRVIAVIPPADGFGSAGKSQIGVSPTDTLVFVVDMIQDIDNKAGVTGAQTSNGGSGLPTVSAATDKAPTVTIPANNPPKTLQVKTLIKGTGPKVTTGQLIVVQYTGVNWRTKKVFDSSWSRSEPFGVNIGEGQVIKGWDTGIVGQTVGSRVLLVIPPAQGYGSAGSSQAGIKGTDTLVFVVDIIDAAGS
jgi:FKBP-type peptidyl-prolyl cis-trans isomerase